MSWQKFTLIKFSSPEDIITCSGEVWPREELALLWGDVAPKEEPEGDVGPTLTIVAPETGGGPAPGGSVVAPALGWSGSAAAPGLLGVPWSGKPFIIRFILYEGWPEDFGMKKREKKSIISYEPWKGDEDKLKVPRGDIWCNYFVCTRCRWCHSWIHHPQKTRFSLLDTGGES